MQSGKFNAMLKSFIYLPQMPRDPLGFLITATNSRQTTYLSLDERKVKITTCMLMKCEKPVFLSNDELSSKERINDQLTTDTDEVYTQNRD